VGKSFPDGARVGTPWNLSYQVAVRPRIATKKIIELQIATKKIIELQIATKKIIIPRIVTVRI
jgi:hypothetical protein